MEPIRVRSPRGEELSFSDQEQLSRAFADGAITAEWLVYERLSGEWLALGDSAGSGTLSVTPAGTPRRSRDIILIYPSEGAGPGNSYSDATTDPLDLVSILTPGEIDRVLGRRRQVGGGGAMAGMG
jgi:hypothetical protein